LHGGVLGHDDFPKEFFERAMQLYLERKVYAGFLELGSLVFRKATPTPIVLLLEKEVFHPISQQFEDRIIH